MCGPCIIHVCVAESAVHRRSVFTAPPGAISPAASNNRAKTRKNEMQTWAKRKIDIDFVITS